MAHTCPGALASTRRCRRGAVRGLWALRGRTQRGLLQLHDNLLRRMLRELPHGHPFCPATSSQDYSEQPSQNKRAEKPRPLHKTPGPQNQTRPLDKKNDKGEWESVGNNCNRDDLCCDGDAIVIANTLENGNDSNAHLLSATLREYYNNSSKLANRFKQIGWSLGANNSTEAYQKISEYADLDSAVLGWFLAGYVKEEIRLTACRKLAEFIY